MRVASYLTLGARPYGEGFTRSVPRATPRGSEGHHPTLQTGKQALRSVATCPQLHSSWQRGWGLKPGSDMYSHYSARSCSRTFDGSPVPMKRSTHYLRGPYGLVSIWPSDISSSYHPCCFQCFDQNASWSPPTSFLESHPLLAFVNTSSVPRIPIVPLSQPSPAHLLKPV